MTEASQVPSALAPAAAVHEFQTEAQKHQIDHQVVMEGRRHFNSYLEEHVLDYFHNNPIKIEECLTTCIKLFGNVVNNPEEEKYRKVRATSHTLKSTVLAIKGGEDLLLHAGWVPRVVDMEKYWLFDAASDSVRFGVLKEALHLTERALHTVHDKAEKKRKERDEKLHHDSAEKERIRLAIEEDKAERRQRAELAAAAAMANVTLAAPAGPGAGAGASPSQQRRTSPEKP